MASASASQSEVEETMLAAATGEAEPETTGNSAEEETVLDVSKERSVSETQERADPVDSSAVRKRCIQEMSFSCDINCQKTMFVQNVRFTL